MTRRTVRGIIRDNVRFDYSMGIAMVKVNVAAHESSKHWISNKMVAEAVLAHVVKKVFGDVFFDPMLHATALENFRQGLLRMLGPQKRQMMSGSGTLMNPPRASVTGHRVWLFCRQPFDNETRKRNTFSFRLGETALWDGRFIISSSLPQSSTDSSSPSSFPQKDPPGLEFVMRPFTSYDYQKILSRLAPKGTTAQPGPHRIYQRILSHFWDVMPAAARQTLPCVAVKSRGGSSESVAIALPSLGINLEPSLGNFDCSFVMDREASEIQLDSLPNLDAYWR